MKRMFNPYKKIEKKKESKEPLLLFPNVKKEINGRKFNYGGEYPYHQSLLYKIKKTMNGNGYDVHFQKREDTVIIWWNKVPERKRRR